MSQSLGDSNNNNNDELLSQFMAFTGTSDADKATSYLEMSGNDVETAVGLYMEHEMGNATGGTSSTMGGGGVAAASNAGYVDLGNDDFDDMLDERDRRTVGGNSSRNSRRTNPRSNRMHTEQDEDGIRAPDQTRTMRLMDDDSLRGGIASMLPPNIASMVMGHNPSYDLMTAMMDEQDLMMMQQQQAAAATASSSAFASTAATVTSLNARALLDAAIARQDQHTQPSSARQRLQQRLQQDEKDSYDDHDNDDDIEYDDDDDDDDNDENNFRGSRNRAIVEPPRLSDMFAAPHHLIHRAGGFQGARTMAKDTKRWLLVNLQRDAEFACHALNRDVWRDELVENLIREGFIFWQQMDTTPEGRTFSERYQVHEYPHISIIDPRTGRLMWRKEGWTQQNALTADSFAEVVMDFCSRNSFDRPPQAPRPPNAAAATTTTSSSSSSTPAKRMHEMSEDELLQEAMKASMSDVAGGTTTTFDSTELVCLDDDLDDSDVQIVEDTKPQAIVTQEEETKTISLSEELQSYVLPDEPTTSTDSSRIQFRLVDGKRITRKFASSDPVRAVYAFVAQTTEEARTTGREFVLMAGFPPNDLLNDIDNSIADVKLNGETITVRWK